MLQVGLRFSYIEILPPQLGAGASNWRKDPIPEPEPLALLTDRLPALAATGLPETDGHSNRHKSKVVIVVILVIVVE